MGAHFDEGGKWLSPLEKCHHVRVLVVEPTEDGQDKCLVDDGFTKVVEGIVHGLHLATIVGDRKIALYKIPHRG